MSKKNKSNGLATSLASFSKNCWVILRAATSIRRAPTEARSPEIWPSPS
jgi:hypothetical protein